jgi:hypothetical protein
LRFALRVQDGEKVEYRTSSGEVLLTGTVVIDTSPNGVSGIRCQCCGDVVSCSQFEAHAGRPPIHIRALSNVFCSGCCAVKRLVLWHRSSAGRCHSCFCAVAQRCTEVVWSFVETFNNLVARGTR